jgi:thiol:disulfide interchange protein
MLKTIRIILGFLFCALALFVLFLVIQLSENAGQVLTGLIVGSFMSFVGWLLLIRDERYDQSSIRNLSALIGTLCIIGGIIFVVISIGLTGLAFGAEPEFGPLAGASIVLTLMFIGTSFIINKRIDKAR